jgi:MFS transporter, DHA2 family, multidrug resistance protein
MDYNIVQNAVEAPAGPPPDLPRSVVPAAEWRPSVNPWLIALAVMLPTFMEVLDTTIVTVSLPHIGGSLSATPEEATWVLTSYLISNAVVLPTTAWLTRVVGRKRFLLLCIVIFTLASAACGAAASLGLLIAARVFQGLGGGALQPIAQAVLLESFPPARRGVAMATFSMGVIVAPILGPTLGGWITDNYSWRWVFYVNLPIGLVAMLMAQAFIEDPPYLRSGRRTRIDHVGLLFMALWLGATQIVLDKGQEADWFSSAWIRRLSLIALVSMVAFVIRELRTRDPVVDLKILANRNFAAGVLLMGLLGVMLYGTTSQLPLFLQTLLGYPALQSGLAVSPRGLGAMLSSLVVGRLIGVVDSRLLIAIGFGFLATSGFMYSHLTLEIAMSSVVAASILNGAATGMIFVPLSTTAMGRLRNEQIANAAGLYNLMRNLGGGVGISVATTLLQRDRQAHQTTLVSHLTPYDPAYRQWLGQATAALAPHGAVSAPSQALALLYRMLGQQALLLAFVDNFRLVAFIALGCIPLVLLFQRVSRTRPAARAH